MFLEAWDGSQQEYCSAQLFSRCFLLFRLNNEAPTRVKPSANVRIFQNLEAKIQLPRRLEELQNMDSITNYSNRKGRGTRDQIANIFQITEKARGFQKNIYFCFTDYAKDFDCVDHNKLWKILKEMRIPDHLT